MKNNYYKYKSYTALCLGCVLLALLLGQGQCRENAEALAGRISPSILRFHVLANSDKDADQAVKLEVRSLILDYMQEALKGAQTKAATVQYLKEHREQVEQNADLFLASRGFDYQAQLTVTREYFPTRIYDRLVIPCGYYDAARIILGRGQGHNWWCVLYPRLCFVDAACTEIPKESQTLLENELNQGDYLALQDKRPELKIRFALFPSWKP